MSHIHERLPNRHISAMVGLLLLAALSLGCGLARAGQSVVATGSPPRCQPHQLRIADAGFAGEAAGTLGEAIAFRAEERCRLSGLPSAWLLSRAGRRLAVVPPERGPSLGPFILMPGYPLYADLFYENPSIRPRFCQLRAYYMAIRPPGGGPRVRVAFRRAPFRLCPGEFRLTGLGQSGPISP